jgi:hypothetical protein
VQRGIDLYAALVDCQQDRLWEGVGTGDDSHEGGMFWLPLYHSRNMLHYLCLNRGSNPKVVRKKTAGRVTVESIGGNW